jgi:hypothetical protein
MKTLLENVLTPGYAEDDVCLEAVQLVATALLDAEAAKTVAATSTPTLLADILEGEAIVNSLPSSPTAVIAHCRHRSLPPSLTAAIARCRHRSLPPSLTAAIAHSVAIESCSLFVAVFGTRRR